MAEEAFKAPNVSAIKLADAGGDVLHDMIDIDGMRVNSFNRPLKELVETVRNIRNLQLRSGDVLLFSYPKSGWFLYSQTCVSGHLY